MGSVEPSEALTESLSGAVVPHAEGRLPFERVGPYRLIRSIGAGGMGEVFLAERDDGSFQQEVAIKLVPFSLSDSEKAGRLRRERQILAQLDHPNLVRVLDGGIAPDGAPYLAMEYVRGLSLRAWLQEWHPSLNERLTRFLELCSAASYAHQRLIVHRDIKPGNIMVDEHGHARLLDFGIAKLLVPDHTDPTLTSAGMAPLTAAYSAPEQVLGGTITTATDIYQLGLVLYELLTGSMAQPVSLTSRASEIERFVCRNEPQRPSRVQPGESGVRLPARIAEDIDTVVAKALHKAADRRYPSAEALAEDIRRIMARKPIMARRDSAFYRARRFVERHLLAVGAGLAVLLALIAFGLHERNLRAEAERLLLDRDEALAQAQAEQKRAESVQEFLLGMFSGADAGGKGHELRVTDVLDEAQKALIEKLADDPEVAITMVRALTSVRVSLGQFKDAGEFLDVVIPMFRDRFAQDDDRVLGLLNERAAVADRLGDYALKLALNLQRRQALVDARGERDPASVNALFDIGASRFNLDRNDPRAWQDMNAAVAMLAEVVGPDHPQTLVLERFALQFMYMAAKHADVVERGPPLYARFSKALGEGNGDALSVLGFTMYSTNALGDTQGAFEISQRLHALMSEHVGQSSPRLINVLNFQAGLHLLRGDYGTAIQTCEKGLEIAGTVLGSSHPSVVSARWNLSMALSLSGQHQLAIELAEQSLAERRQNRGDVTSAVFVAELFLSMLNARAGHFEAARRFSDSAADKQALVQSQGNEWLAELLALQIRMVDAWQAGPVVLDAAFATTADRLRERLGVHDASVRALYLDLRALQQRHGRLPPELDGLLDRLKADRAVSN